METFLYLCSDIKKSQKTPKGEIEHAQSIKDIYFKQK